MALIKCSECGKEISDHASACPSCGNPIHDQVVKTEKPVEIVVTNKKWKKRRLWGLVFLVAGLVVMTKSVGFGFFLLFIAFCIGISANIGAWWTNG